MSEYRSCGKLLKQIHDEMEKRANNTLRIQGLTMMQGETLLILNEAEGKILPLKELERKLHVAQSTAAGIVARLEQKGLVEGLGDMYDKRVKMVRITSVGENYCKEAKESITASEAELLSGLTETERDIFYSLLAKVRNTLK